MPRMDSLSVQGKLICLQTAEINGVCTKDCFVGLFFSFFPIIFIALGKKRGALDPSHNGKLKLCNVNQVFSREQLISFSLKKKKSGRRKGYSHKMANLFSLEPACVLGLTF